MNTYKLLTPGPLTTTSTVKQEMLVDRCTWENDYKEITQKIRSSFLNWHMLQTENIQLYLCREAARLL